MRIYITSILVALLACLASGTKAAQPVQLDPDEIVLVSYEKIYFFLSFRDGTRKKSRTDSTVVFFKSRDGYAVDFNTCQFRLLPLKKRAFDHRGKSYSGIEFKLADPVPSKSDTDPGYCTVISKGGIFLGENEGATFFIYDNLFNYVQGGVKEESIQLYDILWPMRASEAYSPAGRTKWQSQQSIASIPEWLKPAIALGVAIIVQQLFCGNFDYKSCMPPLR
ncbi:hypothetical protein [Bradyrhizobium sp.]|jgi:hypothetical protein|uniref:hypothetical protein n=1 Tax=Bradyrhizobium sp. TaxID=376 RepID=UPI002DF750C4|nr:hypothetical protein [Bradyrhizobium sp.]